MVVSVLSVALQARVARSMTVDDAQVADPKTCGVETWYERGGDLNHYWLVPACTIVRNAELSFGGALYFGDGHTQFSDVWLSGKTLFRTLESSSWSVGLVIGNVHHPNHGGGMHLGDVFAYVPSSVSFAEGRVMLHGNLGLIRADEHRGIRPTWGLGTESHVSRRFGTIAEFYGDTFDAISFQAGLRLRIVPDVLECDATIAVRAGFGHPVRWGSLGLRWLTPAFIP